MPSSPLSATVLTCTYNRASLLRETLSSLSAMRSARPWDVLIVDNNSTDDTRAAVESFIPTFPVPLAYLFEPKQGKSHALNAGLRQTRADVVALTDDDVRLTAGWLDAACAPFEESPDIWYSGGPVRPIWDTTPPSWFDHSRGDLWGTLAILDYGPDPFVFEERDRVPVGANMAVRRGLIDRIGAFHPELGRRGVSLLGQEQAEFLARARATGTRGLYAPAMEVHHHVPAERLTRRYFRRWWHWKGVSRALVDAMHGQTELGLDLDGVPYLAGVPRFIWGQMLRSGIDTVGAALSFDQHAWVRHQAQCCYAIGYVRGCWARRPSVGPAPFATPEEVSSFSR